MTVPILIGSTLALLAVLGVALWFWRGVCGEACGWNVHERFEGIHFDDLADGPPLHRPQPRRQPQQHQDARPRARVISNDVGL